jgi:Phosphorylated adapter RNA export protein, RNA-binding domain
MGVTAKQRELKAARAEKRGMSNRLDMNPTASSGDEADPQRWAAIETAAHIVRTLGEEEYTPRLHLLRIVRLVGPELALELLDEALRIDGDGGELLACGGRYRTPGGIYFRLVRALLTPQEWASITWSG